MAKASTNSVRYRSPAERQYQSYGIKIPRRPKKPPRYDPCSCTTFGGNFGSRAMGKPHAWVAGQCFPRPLAGEVRRLLHGTAPATIAKRYRLSPETVRYIGDGLDLDLEDPNSWVWCCPDEPGFSFEYPRSTSNCPHIIRQEELHGLREYIQKGALGWRVYIVNPYTDHQILRNLRPLFWKPLEPDWQPWAFGHRLSRHYANRVKFYNARIMEGRRIVTPDGRCLHNFAYYQHYRRLRMKMEREIAGDDAIEIFAKVGRKTNTNRKGGSRRA